MTLKPHMLQLPENENKGGKLSFIEYSDLPFEVKRMYWIYGLNENSERGGHSHLNSDRLLICLSGSVDLSLEDKNGEKYSYQLNRPTTAVVFPRNHWIKMQCSYDAIVLALVSCSYVEDKYETNFQQFKSNV